MTVVNLLLAYIWGHTFGGSGVVSAWSLALALSGIILNIMYFRMHEISWRNAIPKGSRLLAVFCLTGMVIAYGIWWQLPDVAIFRTDGFAGTGEAIKFAIAGAMVVAFMVIVAAPMWNHPVRRELWRIVVPAAS